MLSRRFSRHAATALVVSVGVPLVVSISGHPAGAAGVRAGDAMIVDPATRSEVLRSGDSATQFSLRLPSGSACNGDTYNDNYRVQSFIVPAAEDLSTMRFSISGPEGGLGDFRWGLYQFDRVPYANRSTLKNGEPGQPGRIDVIPPMVFPYDAQRLPPGRYRIGIACTPLPGWDTETYWDTEILVTEDPGSTSGALRWEVLSTSEPSAAGEPGSGGSANWVIAVVAGAIVVGGIALATRRRSAHAAEHREKVS